MLRFFLTTIAVSICMVAGAILPDKVYSDHGPYYLFQALPPDLGYNGERTVFLAPEYEDNKLLIDIVNSKLDVIKTLSYDVETIPVTTVVKGPVLEYRWKYSSRAEVIDNLTEAVQLVQAYYPDGFKQFNLWNGNVLFFRSSDAIPAEFRQILEEANKNETSYALEDYLAHTGIYAEYAEYRPSTHIIDFYEKESRYCTGIPTDEIIEYSNETEDKQIRPETEITYYNFDLYTYDFDFPVFQTLINNDEDYEILVPIVSGTRLNSQETDIRVEYPTYNGDTAFTWVTGVKETQAFNITGVAVKSMKTGETLATFEFTDPSDQSGATYLHPYYVVLDNQHYLAINTDNRAYYYMLNHESSVHTPVMVKKVNVTPNFINRGEPINVTLDGDGTISSVTMTGLSGIVEKHINTNGRNDVSIGTSSLSSGMHIIGVKTSDGKTVTEKVIVK